MVICVWNSDFKFAMTCKASERVLSNFKTTLSWLGARSYVVMLSEFWRIVWFAGNRASVELWFVLLGQVIKEFRFGVSSSTSLDDVGPCWFPSSLDELGPCGATTWPVVTEVGLVWIYPCWFELELQLCEAPNSLEFMLGPCRVEVCFNIRIWSSRYLVYLELWELLWSNSWSVRYEGSGLTPS